MNKLAASSTERKGATLGTLPQASFPEHIAEDMEMNKDLIDPQPHAHKFWPKVDIKGSDECWDWTAATIPLHRNKFLRGKFAIKIPGTRKSHYFVASRFAWMLTNGPIPEGMLVCHTCDNPLCCNPGHLFLGTPGDNTRDMVDKGRHVSMGGKPKLRVIDVQEIRYQAKRGIPQSKIAAAFGIKQNTVSQIVSRQRWSRIPDLDLPVVQPYQSNSLLS